MPTTTGLVPGWLLTAAAVGWRLLVTIGIFIVALLVIYAIPVSTTATLVSLVFAATLAPTAMRLRAGRQVAGGLGRAHVRRRGGLLIGVALLLIVILIPDLREIGAAVAQGIEDLRAKVLALGPPEVMTVILDRLGTSIKAALAPDLAGLVGKVADIGTVLVLGTFLTVFLLADGDKGWGWAMGHLQAVAGRGGHRERDGPGSITSPGTCGGRPCSRRSTRSSWWSCSPSSGSRSPAPSP